MNARGFNVYAALEGSLGLEAIREALPVGTPVRAVSLAEAGHAGNEIQQGADLVIVGCSQSHDQALDVISAATAQRADRPVVVLYQGIAERVPRAGLRGRRRRPRRAAAVGGAARVRAREGAGEAARAGSLSDRGSDDHSARAEGWHRQDGHVLQPGGRARARGQVGGARRPRPAVRRRRARARPGADPDDLRPRRLRRLARRREDRRVPGAASLGGAGAARAAPAGSGGGDRDAVPARGVRDPALALRLPHRRHAPGLHARGDRGGGRFHAPLRRRDARRALAQGHEARARDPGADGLRPEGGHARAQPRGLGRGHHAVGCRAAARSGARRARRQRPRDSPRAHERTADRRRRATVESGPVVRGACRAVSGGNGTAGRGRSGSRGRRVEQQRRRRLSLRKAS